VSHSLHHFECLSKDMSNIKAFFFLNISFFLVQELLKKRNWKCKYIFSTGRHLKSLCHTPYIFGCLSKDGNISWTTCLILSQKISKDRQYITAINSVYCLTCIPFQKLIIKLLFLFCHVSYLLYSVTYLDKWPLCRTVIISGIKKYWEIKLKYCQKISILGNKAKILKISMKIVFVTSIHYFLLSNTLKICFFLNVTPKVSHSLHFRHVFLT
jgi:hypothetical protein